MKIFWERGVDAIQRNHVNYGIKGVLIWALRCFISRLDTCFVVS